MCAGRNISVVSHFIYLISSALLHSTGLDLIRGTALSVQNDIWQEELVLTFPVWSHRPSMRTVNIKMIVKSIGYSGLSS